MENKKQGIFELMIRDIKLWFFLRWLDVVCTYTKRKNPINQDREEGDDYLRYGFRTNYINFIYFEHDYSKFNPFIKYFMGGLPFWISKRFIPVFETNAQMTDILFSDDKKNYMTDPDCKGVIKLIKYGQKQGFIESSNDNEDSSFIGVSVDGEGVNTWSGFFTLMISHWQFVSVLTPVVIYLWANLIGVWEPIIKYITNF